MTLSFWHLMQVKKLHLKSCQSTLPDWPRFKRFLPLYCDSYFSVIWNFLSMHFSTLLCSSNIISLKNLIRLIVNVSFVYNKSALCTVAIIFWQILFMKFDPIMGPKYLGSWQFSLSIIKRYISAVSWRSCKLKVIS